MLYNPARIVEIEGMFLPPSSCCSALSSKIAVAPQRSRASPNAVGSSIHSFLSFFFFLLLLFLFTAKARRQLHRLLILRGKRETPIFYSIPVFYIPPERVIFLGESYAINDMIYLQDIHFRLKERPKPDG